jgi:hypothetical protein
VLIALSLAHSHWWQRQRSLSLQTSTARGLELAYGLVLMALLHFWLQPRFAAEEWMMITIALAAGVTLYGAVTRCWMLAAAGQVFAVASVLAFVRQLVEGHPGWAAALVPMLGVLGLAAATQLRLAFRPDAAGQSRPLLLDAATLYRWVALAMSCGWIQEYVPFSERLWAFSLLSLALFAWGAWRGKLEAFLASGVLTVAALGQFWLRADPAGLVYLPNLLALVALAAEQAFGRRLPGCAVLPPPWHAAIVAAAGLSLWRFFSLWVLQVSPGGFYLTAAWAVLAFGAFSAGLLLAERSWRWLGLGILAAALSRVVLLDVWKLDTLYRTVSFFALGVVLLAVGFIYNRFQDRIRRLL